MTTLRVARGSTLRYVVELHNASTNQALQFHKCPLFVQELAPKGSIQAYRLNCGAAQALEPGRSIRFDIALNVPSNAPTGDNGLFWELDPLGAQGPEATARVVITSAAQAPRQAFSIVFVAARICWTTVVSPIACTAPLKSPRAAGFSARAKSAENAFRPRTS